ncbi:MAG: aspartyl protease family protein [Bacteroidota bacterium]
MKKVFIISLSLFIGMATLTGMVPFMGEEIKAVSFRPKPIIKGTLNGKKAYFLLDSGADVTLLDESTAENFGFKTVKVPGANKIQGVNRGAHEVEEAKKAEMKLGTQHIKYQFKTFNISHLANSIMNKTGYRICGIIGSDVMKKYGFIIDYSNHKVLIQKTR